MDRETALQLARAVKQCAVALDSQLPTLKAALPESEFQIYKRSIARILNMLDVHIIQHMVTEHPDVDPWSECSPKESNG